MTYTQPRANQRRRQSDKNRQKTIVWRNYFIYSSVFLTLLLATGSALWSLNQSLSVKQWHIYAPTPIKSAIQKQLSMLDNLDFWHSRPSVLRKHLLATIPDLADIHIQRQLPSTLNIHITARQAIALWQSDKQLYLVDHFGTPYRPRKLGEASDLPLLRMKKQHLKMACFLLNKLKRNQPEWFASSSELFAQHDGWKLNLTAGQQWLLPLGERALSNIHRLNSILQQPRWHAGNWRVDTRLDKRWFIRPATHEGVI